MSVANKESLNFMLSGTGAVVDAFHQRDIYQWQEAKDYVAQLPYARISNAQNPLLVITEKRGTCSSKHALLVMLAHACQHQEVQLQLVFFKMNGSNTPKLASLFPFNGLNYFPEAHCYMYEKSQVIDITFPDNGAMISCTDILSEQSITVGDLVLNKVAYHQQYIHQWMRTNRIAIPFATLWAFREQCINTLSQDQ